MSLSEQGAKNMAGPLDMLIEIQRRAPDALHLQLVAFRDAQWKSLNSFVHAGIHPLSRATSGFPKVLAIQIAKTTNALAHIAYRLSLVRVVGWQRTIVSGYSRLP